MTDDSDLIRIAIEKMVDVVNEEVALRQARTVPDLELAEDGTVEELRAPGEQVLKELVEAYSEIMGGVAESLIAYELRDRAGVDADDLPDILAQHL